MKKSYKKLLELRFKMISVKNDPFCASQYVLFVDGYTSILHTNNKWTWYLTKKTPFNMEDLRDFSYLKSEQFNSLKECLKNLKENKFDTYEYIENDIKHFKDMKDSYKYLLKDLKEE